MTPKITSEMRAALNRNPGEPIIVEDESDRTSYVLIEQAEYDRRCANFGYSQNDLRQLIQEGIDSGPAVPAEEAFRSLRQYADELAKSPR